MKLFRPTTLVHATNVARLQEEKLERIGDQPPKIGLIPLPQPRSSPNPTSNSQILPSATFKKLSWSEMQDGREKGLCYNCDEKFGPGHRSKTTPQVFLPDTLDEAEAYGGKTLFPHQNLGDKICLQGEGNAMVQTTPKGDCIACG